MEPSLSFDASIVLRSGQDESRYGTRVVFDSASGAIRSDHDDAVTEGPAPASLRAVAGRWLFDAASESRVRINGVAVAGARVLATGDDITIAGSQLLVEEVTAGTLALRRFDLVGNDTLPPVGDSVRMLTPPAEYLAIDLGDVPTIEWFVAPRIRRVSNTRWNYAAWVMGGLLAVVLAMFAMLKPIALDLRPGDAVVKSVGSFSWQSASSVFVFPGEHRLRAEREGYVPAEIPVTVGGDRRSPAQRIG